MLTTVRVVWPLSKMDQIGRLCSWRLAFEMVELDRMGRPTHNGAESGHQLPLEDGACAPPFWTGGNVY